MDQADWNQQERKKQVFSFAFRKAVMKTSDWGLGGRISGDQKFFIKGSNYFSIFQEIKS